MTEAERKARLKDNGGCCVEEVMESYQDYLQRYVGAGEVRAYQTRWENNFEAAATEAAVFCMLQQYDLRPSVYERVGDSKPKPDFVCGEGVNKFYVEATSFRKQKVTGATGLPSDDVTLKRSYAFELMTREICQRLEEKSVKYQVCAPLVLVLGSDHAFSNIVFGRLGVEFAMTGKTTIAGTGRAQGETEFALFLRLGEHDRVEPRHEDISCVLLLRLGETTWRTLGMLHPQPSYPIQADLFGDVPFARITPWPPHGGRVDVGWILDRQHALPHPYCLVSTPDRAARPPTGKP